MFAQHVGVTLPELEQGFIPDMTRGNLKKACKFVPFRYHDPHTKDATLKLDTSWKSFMYENSELSC